MGSSFIGNFYYSTLSDFVAVATLSNIFMWLCECKYIWMQICIYVVMFVLPRSHNPRQRYFNNEALQLIQKDPDVVSQETFLLEHMVKVGGGCPKIMQPYFSQSVLSIFLKTFYHDDTQIYLISVHVQLEISPCEGNRKFLLGCGLTRDAFDYSNLFQS